MAYTLTPASLQLTPSDLANGQIELATSQSRLPNAFATGTFSATNMAAAAAAATSVAAAAAAAATSQYALRANETWPQGASFYDHTFNAYAAVANSTAVAAADQRRISDPERAAVANTLGLAVVGSPMGKYVCH